MIDKAALICRYSNAYGVATITNGIGKVVQIAGLIFGVVTGGLSALIGVSLGGMLGNAFALFIGALGGVIGILPGAFISLLGVLLSAHGQMLLATLDSTVSLSPFLDDSEKAKIMHLQTQQQIPSPYTPAQTNPPPLDTLSQGVRLSDNEQSVAQGKILGNPSNEDVTRIITAACMVSLGIKEFQMESSFQDLRIPQGKIFTLLDDIDAQHGFYLPPIDREGIKCAADVVKCILKSKR